MMRRVVNYLSHARNHLDRPYALAGTSLPDWMSVSDRRHRLRREALPRPAPTDTSPAAEILRGVLAHFEDDAWFHGSVGFQRVNAALTGRIRAAYPDRPEIRASFFGHVLVEILLDVHLMQSRPDALDAYYAALDALDVETVLAFVREHSEHSTRRLRALIDGFRASEFLRSYEDDAGVTLRLNQVGRRLRQPALPDDFDDIVGWARAHVREHAPALLTRGA